MRGVVPSLFSKPPLGRGLSPHPLTADVSALLPVPILQHPGRLGNGADGFLVTDPQRGYLCSQGRDGHRPIRSLPQQAHVGNL